MGLGQVLNTAKATIEQNTQKGKFSLFFYVLHMLLIPLEDMSRVRVLHFMPDTGEQQMLCSVQAGALNVVLLWNLAHSLCRRN
jgi:hypothetical protein